MERNSVVGGTTQFHPENDGPAKCLEENTYKLDTSTCPTPDQEAVPTPGIRRENKVEINLPPE